MAAPKPQTLTPVQIYALARNAGLDSAAAVIATGIALAESGGRSWVTSPNPDGGQNVGLWQLDTPGGKGAGYTVDQLQDPYINARAMAAGSSNGNDFSAWQTFVKGTWQNFQTQAQDAAFQEAASHGKDWISQILKDVEGAASRVGKAVSSATSGDFWSSVDSALTSILGTILPGSTALAKLIGGAGPGGGIAALLAELIQVLDWSLHPAHWVRIFCGLAGGVLVFMGIWTMTHVGEGA